MEKYRRPRRGQAPVPSMDGMVRSGRMLGVPRAYQPSRGRPTATLGNFNQRTDGFYPAQGSSRSDQAEADEAHLLDEPIVLDHQPVNKKKKHYLVHKHPRLRKVVIRGGLVILAFFVITGGFLGWKVEKDLAKVFHGNLLSVFRPVTKLKGEDSGRVNILLAGNSTDDPGHDGANLTDSIMLISLDTTNNTGYLLSIPRDLWTNYDTNQCSVGYQGKINAVYECGQEIKFNKTGFPPGGMGLLEQVVGQDFGVNINYYALINYGGLRDAVNAVGGINFTVNSPDYCPYLRAYGLYDGGRDYTTHSVLVSLANGNHVLNGEQALDLSRARGDPPYPSCGYENSDFTRTQNQRQELLNLKIKALSVGILSNPVKLSDLLDTVGANLQTDFKANEILRLYSLTKQVPNSSIKSIGLTTGGNHLLSSGNINGASALIPAAGRGDFGDIQSYIRRLDSNDPVVQEGASVVILNGSNTVGLAAKLGTQLTGKGLDVQSTGDAAVRAHTVLVALNNNNPNTKSYLLKTLNLSQTTAASSVPQISGYTSDFVIILGNDAAPPATQ